MANLIVSKKMFLYVFNSQFIRKSLSNSFPSSEVVEPRGRVFFGESVPVEWNRTGQTEKGFSFLRLARLEETTFNSGSQNEIRRRRESARSSLYKRITK
jgi:hypothetical protein